MELINKAAVVAELERLIETNKAFKKTWKWKFKWFYRTIIGRLETLEGLKAFIDTLEVKEVDLEKEYKDFVEEDPVYNKLVNSIVGKAIAKHFFELGIKQKDK